jgi:hypothetical protein
MSSLKEMMEKNKPKLLNLSALIIVLTFPLMYIGLTNEIPALQVIGMGLLSLVMFFALIEPKKKKNS